MSGDHETRLTGARLLDQELERKPGVARFKLIPDGAVLYHLEGGPSWSLLRPGRYVAFPDAIQALRDIAAGGDPWAAERARRGLGGWT